MHGAVLSLKVLVCMYASGCPIARCSTWPGVAWRPEHGPRDDQFDKYLARQAHDRHLAAKGHNGHLCRQRVNDPGQ